MSGGRHALLRSCLRGGDGVPAGLRLRLDERRVRAGFVAMCGARSAGAGPSQRSRFAWSVDGFAAPMAGVGASVIAAAIYACLALPGGGCGATTEDECVEADCPGPPAPLCVDDVLVTWGDEPSCVDDECAYESFSEPCSAGCEEAEVDGAVGVRCAGATD